MGKDVNSNTSVGKFLFSIKSVFEKLFFTRIKFVQNIVWFFKHIFECLQLREGMKPILVELYVRALTTDMNELELQKSKKDKEKVRETEERLSGQFLKLADVLGNSVIIAKECVLTAFSLNPTWEIFHRLREIATACGKVKSDDVNRNPNQAETKEEETLSQSPAAPLPSEKISSGNTRENLTGANPLLMDLLSSPRKNQVESGIKCNQHATLDELCFECTENMDSKIKMEKSVEVKPDPDAEPANDNEKSLSNLMMLDCKKLGLSEQLGNDLSVIWSSQRYHILNWMLDWSELSGLCEKYLVNVKETRAGTKELKYLHIDYSQFKNWPIKSESSEDMFVAGGIEKGYEPWADVHSDDSEQYGSFQPAGKRKRSSVRRSLNDTSDSDTSSNPRKRSKRASNNLVRSAPKVRSSGSEYDSNDDRLKNGGFVKRKKSVSDSDTNTQDSQTDSLGSDGYRQESKKSRNKITKKLNSAQVRQQVRQQARQQVQVHEDEDEDEDENVSPYQILVNTSLQQRIEDASGSDVSSGEFITLFSADMDEKREIIKASEYTPAAPLLIAEKRTNPETLKQLRMFRRNHKTVQGRDNNNVKESSSPPGKFAPMLSTLNLSPKIIITRSEDAERLQSKKKKPLQYQMNIEERKGRQRAMGKKSSPSKFRHQGGGRFEILKRDSDILAKRVPGMNSLDMMVPPLVRPTVNVVQLPRNISQSPNSGNSGHTPPRNRTSNLASSVQLPGTPMSGGHDSGVGMSPAGQTPPPRSVGEETNQPQDASSPMDSAPDQSQSPKKSPSPSTASHPIGSEQMQLVYSINPSPDSGLLRQQVAGRNSFDRLAVINKPLPHSAQNAGLPKFQHAFGKSIYPADGTTAATSSTTDTVAQSTKTAATNLSKAVQTSAQSAQQSIANIPTIRAQSAPKQILVQNSGTASPTVNQTTLTQLVKSIQTSSGLIYTTHNIPVTVSTANPNQLNIISNALPGGNPIMLNLIRTGSAGAQAAIVRTTPRIQQQTSTPQQTSATQQTPTPQPQQASTTQPPQAPPTPQQQPTENLMDINQTNQSTLEQLREFESVLEQVKGRSTIQPAANATSTSTAQTQTAQNPGKLQQRAPAQIIIPPSTSNSAEFASNSSSLLQQTLAEGQQQLFQQKVVTTYVNPNGPKITNSTPVVVVTSYCQPSASPTLSVTSQSSSSPCVTPAPATTPATSVKSTSAASPKASAKKAGTPKVVKSSSSSSSATNTSKVSPIAKPQQKPQEDEQTTQRIFAILTEYAEQLRNSPDLNNKPAPRRRSNPPTNPSQNSKRKKSSSGKAKPAGQQTSELSPSADDLGRTMGSEDSSSGVAHVQDSPAGFSSAQEETPTPGGGNETSSEARNDSNDDADLGSGKRRGVMFTEQSAAAPPAPRTMIVQEAVQTVNVSEVAGKLPGNAAVLVPGNWLVKPGSQITWVSGPKILTTVPATVRSAGATGVSNALVLQSILNQSKFVQQSTQVKQVKLPMLQNLVAQQQQQGQTVVIPQNSGGVPFEDARDKEVVKVEQSETSLPGNATTILVNKTQTIGIIPRNIGEEGQQICGVITSNPNMTLQGPRLFNSSIAKLSSSAGGLKTENVVCLTPTATVTQSSEKRLVRDGKSQGEKQIQTIALAFTSQSDAVVKHQIQKEGKALEAISSPKILKRKLEEANDPRHFITPNHTVASSTVVSDTKIGKA